MTRSSSSRRRSRRCVTKWNAFASRMTTACRSWNGRVAMNATSCSGRSWRSERIWSETMPDPQPTPALLLDPDAAKRLRQAELLLDIRSEEHMSELQSLMRISYAVFCLKKKKTHNNNITQTLKTTLNNYI